MDLNNHTNWGKVDPIKFINSGSNGPNLIPKIIKENLIPEII